MHRLPAAFLLLALAACGASPREECLALANAELETVERLIDDTEANLLRGYALEPDESREGGFKLCAGGNSPLSFCAEREEPTQTRPVAINPVTERIKLANLESRRTNLAALAARDAAQCEALYNR